MENTTVKLVIATELSPWAGGRFRSDGEYSGERFRDEFLIPKLNDKNISKVIVSLIGTIGLGSSFKEELFGGAVRSGVDISVLREKLEIESKHPTDSVEIWKYIEEAQDELVSSTKNV